MFPSIELRREEENFQYGTFGLWVINKEIFSVTLEPPDIENASNISSIPAQQYMCERVVSPKYGNVFEVKNVPFRTHVLIHKGNVVDNTLGCILLASHFGKLKADNQEKRAILNSGNTFNKFMELMSPYNNFHLTVKENY